MSKRRKTLAEEQAELAAAFRDLGRVILIEFKPLLNWLAAKIGRKR